MKAPSTVSDLSRRLGLSPRRIRALARSGRIPAVKAGRTWVFPDPRSVRVRGVPGRPLRASNAWALLALLSGASPAWVHPSVRSRLRRRLLDPAWVEGALMLSEPRSRVHRWRVLPSDLDRLRSLPGLVRTGLAAEVADLDVVPLREALDAYVDPRSLERLRGRLRPDEDPSRPNVSLRVPSHPWVLEMPGMAPPAVVAADLLDHEDPRVAAAARRLLHGFVPAGEA